MLAVSSLPADLQSFLFQGIEYKLVIGKEVAISCKGKEKKKKRLRCCDDTASMIRVISCNYLPHTHDTRVF